MLGKGATSEAGKYLFRAANVWWRYVLYFVIVLLFCYVCIWRMFVFISVVLTVWGSVGMFFCVAAVVKDSGISILVVLKYVVCLCKGCDGCCVFCLYCDACSCR